MNDQEQQQLSQLAADLASLRVSSGFLYDHVAALEAELLLAQQGRQPRLPIQFRSQFHEDSIAWRLLGRSLTGTFIEAGAFDGWNLSTTYALEAIGWSGLLIEPVPERAASLASTRPYSKSLHAALGPPDCPPSVTLHMNIDNGAGGLHSHTDTSTKLAAAMRANHHWVVGQFESAPPNPDAGRAHRRG